MDYSGLYQYMLRKLQNELPSNLHYHGVHHTIDVLDASIKIASAEGVTGDELIFLQTAVMLHDSGYIEKYNENEDVARELALQVLPGFNYNSDQIAIVNRLIDVTRVSEKPQTLLEKIICDADHDYFGRSDYKSIAATLYREMIEYGVHYTEREWIVQQINFLTNKHQYYTTFSIENREPGKVKNLQKLKERLDAMM
jgi:hypothetical protein